MYYTITPLSENPHTGVRTWRVPAEAVAAIEEWARVPAEKLARAGRRAPKAGTITFKSGGNYDIIDANLLGGTGDGRLRQRLEDEAGVRIGY